MVILLSALAVVVAAILIVTWFVVGGGFALIYAAMALAVVSMLLLWAARWIGSTPERVGREEPEPLRELASVAGVSEGWADAGDALDLDEVASVDEPDDADADADADAAVSQREQEAVRPRRVAAAAARPGREHAADGPGDGLPVFPIAEYDTLWVSQIVPLLAELDPDELAVVEARERGGRHRAAVLDAVHAHRDGRPVPAPTPRRSARDAAVDDVAAEPVEAPEPVSLEIDGDELAEEEARWAAWSESDPGASLDHGLALDDEDDRTEGEEDDLFAEIPGSAAAVEVDHWHLPEDDGASEGDEADEPVEPDGLALDDDADDAEPEAGGAEVDAPDPVAADEDDDVFVAGVPDLDLGELPPPPPGLHHAPHPTEDLDGDPALYDWTRPEPDVDPSAAAPGSAPEVEGEVEGDAAVDPPVVIEALASAGSDGDDDAAWDVDEPSAWDWSGVRADAAAEGDGEAEVEAEAGGDPDPDRRIRTFLGRRQSSLTIQD